MNDETTKRRRGCWFYGCLVSGLLLLVVLIAVLAGLSYAKRMVTRFTDARPVALPTVQATPEQIDQVRQRYSTFRQALSQHRPIEPLSLSAQDMNILIAHEPQFAGLKDKVYVGLQDNRVKAQVSVPLAELGLRVFRDRYLNGTATLAVSLTNGLLRVTVENVVAKNKPLPGIFMNKLRQQNLAQGHQEDSRTSIALEQLQDIQVKDAKLIVTPKSEKLEK